MTESAATTPAQPAHRRTRPATDIALIAAFAALIAVCALLPAISVGGAVSITLQTFAVMLAGAVLGARRGFLAVLLYLAVGAIGIPVFSGGAAGLAPFAGPSVGYLVGFPFAALATGFFVERLPRAKIATSIPLIFLAGLAASFIFIHPLGILGMAWRADLTLSQAFLADLAFWPGDVVKNLLMGVVATAVHRAFPTILPQRRRARASAATAPAAPAAPSATSPAARRAE
ncbi:biotin transporter BioY [Leucobacter luti]|uniref:Biotin transport system substrate-specific component n=1 Tax=Leucobacter luti TaxID=340320 RepID=A0A4Q7U158_9MICO|nr:biotin transporter BioY [Leucobacter luti]MBL3699602.1 biotin transporter BioY [Leucobacter luti]RZT67114.1 biotin transport system substrate-specific component [Leucobacter luti]